MIGRIDNAVASNIMHCASSRRTARPGKQRPNPLAISRRDDKSRCRAMLGALPISTEAAPMPTVQSFPAGGYRFISHQFQYSGGVAAEPGFRVERARFARPLPLAEGFDAIEAYLAGIGRSPTAFCACELRSPAQFTDAGFVAFNRHYVERLVVAGPFAMGAYRLELRPRM